MKRKKNIVTIGGGTGTFMVLSALKDYPVNLTAIVSMADDGGSTGILRDEYGVLPPGDVRRALVALAESSETLRELFNYRFINGGLEGHSFGNIFLTALEKVTGGFDLAIYEAAKILNVRGEVVPVTLENVRLHARLADRRIIKGETNIDIPKSKSRAEIKEIWLEPEAKINPRAEKVIAEADLIVIGPGDIYTSLIPNLIVKGVPEVIRKSKAKKVYVANMMTKFGETDNFKAIDFVKEIEAYLGKNVLDFAIFNNKKPSPSVIKRYLEEKAEFVDPSDLDTKSVNPKYILADLLDSGKFVRHSPKEKLAKVIISLV